MFPAQLIVVLRRTLLAAAMLAAFLGCANPASAALLCTVPEGVTQEDGSICRNFLPGESSKYYWFDIGTGFDHLLRVTVDTVLPGPETSEVGFGLRFLPVYHPAGYTYPGFPDFPCLAYAPPDPTSTEPTEPTCVEYQAIDDEGQPIDDDDPPDDFQPFEGLTFDYLGDVTWLIAWSYPTAASPIPQIIHERGEFDLDEVYDEALTEGFYFNQFQGPSDFACDNPIIRRALRGRPLTSSALRLATQRGEAPATTSQT